MKAQVAVSIDIHTWRENLLSLAFLFNPLEYKQVRMAEWSKALRSGRSPLLWAGVRISLLTKPFSSAIAEWRSGSVLGP